jgi:penicillin-insensitive murein DD-endopeptidase
LHLLRSRSDRFRSRSNVLALVGRPAHDLRVHPAAAGIDRLASQGRSTRWRGAGPTLLLALSVGCAPLGVTGDGTSVSGGQPNRGWLLDGRRLADDGDGFITHAQWRARGLRFATDELIALITNVARQIQPSNAPVRLAIADLSFEGGGPADPFHRSHQSGRDADLLLFLVDAAGRPYESAEMKVLDDAGVAVDGSRHRLDVPRTWHLVRALVTAAGRSVQYLFLAEPLTQRLLDHARAIGEPAWVIDTARLALLEPSGAPHNDHLHVRVFCSPTDLDVGCHEFGNMSLRDKRLEEHSIWRGMNAQLLWQLSLAGPALLALVLTPPGAVALPDDGASAGVP